MGCTFKCDVCRKEESAANYNGGFHKPREWFIRTDPTTEKSFVACSRECIDKGAKDKIAGFEHAVVLPW